MKYIDKAFDYLILLLMVILFLSGLVIAIDTVIDSVAGQKTYYNRFYYVVLVTALGIGLSIYFIMIKAHGKDINDQRDQR